MDVVGEARVAPSSRGWAPAIAVPGGEAGRVPTVSTVFGLDVRSTICLPSLERSRALATGRTLDLRQIPADSARTEWPAGARQICSQRHPDGSVCFCIEAHPVAGYRIWGKGRGFHLLSRDGRRLSCAPEGSAGGWERFLVGQVLPFAALASGLEIFHASAIVIDGQAVAFVGPSGAGKTSVALEACGRGASFLADDVLALEPRERTLIAHAGTPLAGVDRREVRRRAQAGTPLANEVIRIDAREELMRVPGAAGAARLGALFFLERRSDSGALRFEPAGEARALLASTFNLVLDTPQRMRGLLDVCALAARCRVERILVTPHVDPGALATAVLERVTGAA